MSLIADASVLREDWVPGDLRHRHGTLEELATALEGLGGVLGCAFVSGPPGAGKTVCAQYLRDQLVAEKPELVTSTLECSTVGSRWSILFELLRQTGRVAGVSRSSANHHDLVQHLRDEDRSRLVILDEADCLEDDDVVADLLSVEQLGLVATANDRDSWVDGLDGRLQSRVRSRFRFIEVDAYTTAQLVGILDDRVHHGLGHAVINDKQVERIAERAAGDARLAISILRKAAIQARDEGAEEITATHVAEAVPPARRDVRRTSLSKLNSEQLLLYRLVYEYGPIQAGDLHDRYEAESDDPVCDRTRRHYLSKLAAYDLVAVDGETRWREYRLAEPAPDPL